MKKTLLFYLSALLALSACETEHLYGPEGILQPLVDNCDTVDITYTIHIKPIIEANCPSCHDVTVASGKVVLDSYEEVKKAVNEKDLRGAVNYDTKFSNMPPTGKMNNCNLLQIDAWIKQGMKE